MLNEKMDKTKKTGLGRIIALVTSLIILSGISGGVFVFRDEISDFFPDIKTFIMKLMK